MTNSSWKIMQRQYDLPHLRIRQVASLVNRIKPGRMADLGCARGKLHELCPGTEYIGCDMVAPEGELNFQFLTCDFNSEPLPEAIMNMPLIVCSGILEYIVGLPEFLTQVQSRLAPGGICVATYFNMNHISRCMDLIRGRTLPMHEYWHGFYSPRAIRRMFLDVGFSIDETYATSHSFGRSPAVSSTTRLSLRLNATMPWSGWLAHQFVYVCSRR